MLEKFIQSEELCMNIGVPTALGWVIFVGLVLISVLLFWRAKK